MNRRLLKRIVDVALSVALILLLSFSVTGMKIHEYMGVIMLILVVIHQILNRSFYKRIFKRSKTAFSLYLKVIDLLTIACFVILMLAGLSMSAYIPTFLHGILNPILARRLHLGLSYYLMILFGLHLGAHINEKRIRDAKLLTFMKVIAIIPALIGLNIFSSSQGLKHLSFSLVFATMGGSRVLFLTIIEVILMCFPFVYLGLLIKNLILNKARVKRDHGKK